MSEAPAPPPAAPQKAGGLSIVSLICGIASYLLCLGILSGIPAIITGHLALGKAKRGEAGGRGLALAGLILGYISIAVTIIFILMGGLAFILGSAPEGGPAPTP